ncbi:MAG: FRG domain-containing protein [Cyanobacteriota bacterium]
MHFGIKDDLKTWSEIRDYLQFFVSDWCFRGQRDSAWGLKTSLERATTRIPNVMAEHTVLRHFTRNAHNYLQAHHIPVDLLEWFALMQHHGAPTRLLDMTTSPYVACFFAVENSLDETGSSAVWAVDENWCQQQGRDVIRKHLANDPHYSNYKVRSYVWKDLEFRKIFEQERIPLVMPAEPYRRNERLTIQSGLFLCPGDPNKGFEGNFGEYDQKSLSKHLIKVVIPNKLRVEILTDLYHMNINRATLFPGIDGFSQSLKQQILNLEDHGLIHKRVLGRMKLGEPFV